MIILLYGSDTYRQGIYEKSMRDAYAAKHSAFAVYEFDGASEEGLQGLRDICAAQSLFAPLKLVALHNLFPIPEGQEKQYKKFFEGLVERADIVVMIVANDAPPKAFAFLLQQAKPAKEFPAPIGPAFERFIREEAGRCGARLTPTLLRDLGRAFAGDTWGVVAELQKIASGGTYAAEAYQQTQNFFGALMELQHSAPSRALPLLERLLTNDDEAKLFNVLASRVSPSAKMRFADYDIAIKSGKMDYALALTDYVLGQ
ncbi:MAG: hypothetical protein Q7R85_01205 [bacterium]|nr:hypothetical protein [bacterium]